jgi:hypothetical protein
MWQAQDREGALDEKAESRVVSAGSHGLSIESLVRQLRLPSGVEHLYSRSTELYTGCMFDSWSTREASDLVDGVVV